VKPYLLDVNLLVALSWPAHEHHDAAQHWFQSHQSSGFATCPFTQAGLVRILSNPAAVSGAVSPMAAARLLERVMALPGHVFWPDDLIVSKLILARSGITGHRQIMDAYLIEMARTHGGILATLDRAAATLAGKDQDLVEVVGRR
jgi:uncharacterized protein